MLSLNNNGDRIHSIYLHPSGPSILELALRISLLKYVKPIRYFEFGTYLGVSVLNMAVNMSKWGGEVITLDLDKFAFQNVKLVDRDIQIAERHLNNLSKLVFLNTPYEKQITCLYGDSTKCDLSKYYKKIEMIYIDGGHDLKTVSSDTKNALNMLPERDLSCIIWHDYKNPNPSYKVTHYLDKLAKDYNLYYIEETKLVFYLKNATKKVIERLS